MGRFLIAHPENEVHRLRSAPESAEECGALGTVALAMKGDLDHRSGDGDPSARKGAWLDLSVKFCGRGAG